MQLFALITLETAQNDSCTVDAVITVNADTTRQDVYRTLRQKVAESCGQRFADAKVVYFSAEPNSFGG